MTIHPRKVLSAFGWSFVQSWGSQLTKLGVFIVLARLLDPRDIGLVAFAMVFVQGAQAFALTGVSDALIQKRDLNNETVNAVFWLNIFIATALALALFFSAPFLQTWFKMDGLAPVLRWMCPVLLLHGLASVQIAQFQRNLQMRPIALRELLASILGGATGVLAAVQGWGVYALVVTVGVGQLLGTLFLWWSSSWRPSLRVEWAELNGLACFALSRTGSSSLASLNTRLDDLFIGVFLGPVALGYYAVAYRVLQAVNQTASMMVGRAAFPLFAQFREDSSAMKLSFAKISRASGLLAVGLFSGILFLSPQVVPLLFGPEWTASIFPMQILCVAGFLQNNIMLNRVFLRASGHADWELYTFILQALLCAVGFYLAAQAGIAWVAFALMIVLATVLPVVLILNVIASRMSLLEYFRGFLAPLLGALLAGSLAFTVALFDGLDPLAHLLVAGSVFFLTYVAWIVVIERHQLAALRRIIFPKSRATPLQSPISQ
jgi:O-antigen/teichoic acid export membrane protein